METVTPNAQSLERSVKDILTHFDMDSDREGLRETPGRYIKFLEEFLNPAPFKFTTFDAEGYDEMIVQTNIPFYSLCEHHIAPFFGTGSIAYIPGDKIVGLSKLARVLDKFARRFQNQERITKQVADYLTEQLDPKGVGVVLRAQHLCMSMRGVEKHDTWTMTSQLTGRFLENQSSRSEFLSLINK